MFGSRGSWLDVSDSLPEVSGGPEFGERDERSRHITRAVIPEPDLPVRGLRARTATLHELRLPNAPVAPG